MCDRYEATKGAEGLAFVREQQPHEKRENSKGRRLTGRRRPLARAVYAMRTERERAGAGAAGPVVRADEECPWCGRAGQLDTLDT